MKKDGKLFGKINIIDLLVIILIVVVIAGVALKMTGHFDLVEPELGTDVTYTVRVANVDQDVYDNIKEFVDTAIAAGKPGDQLMAGSSLVNAYVTDVTAVPQEAGMEVEDSTGYLIFHSGNGDKMILTFTIQGHTDSKTTTAIGSQEVRVGKSHVVKTTHFELADGTIISCQWADGTSVD
ncbi:MAG: DUF4330 family protein [Clostridiales bacterium]|nr:DUF4330 family protein [Clostridiales bacterium]